MKKAILMSLAAFVASVSGVVFAADVDTTQEIAVVTTEEANKKEEKKETQVADASAETTVSK